MSKSKSKASAEKDSNSEARKAAAQRLHALQNGWLKQCIACGSQVKVKVAVILAILYQFAFNGKVSGRMDGNVLMRNGRGRGMVVPALVQNAYTTLMRSILSGLSTFYSTLSVSEIASWRAMEWYFKSNRFGVSKAVRGKEAFISLNANIGLAGGTNITVAPIAGGEFTTVTDWVITADQSLSTILAASASLPVSADTVIIVKATRPLSTGTTRPSESDFRLIPILINSASTSPVDLTAAYQAKFGSAWDSVPYLGGKIFFKFTSINSLVGNAGGTIVVESVIQA